MEGSKENGSSKGRLRYIIYPPERANEDARLLSELGLLELRRNKTDKERLEPVIEYDKIMIEIDVNTKTA